MREALVWNFEDDNFTWMDASSDEDSYLEPVICIKYQPDPGWQVRWADLDNGVDDTVEDPDIIAGSVGDLATTWAALESAGTRWSDFTSGPAEENMYWLTATGVMIADQYVKTDGIKYYFVERERIDLNDVVASFTTDKWIYAKQMYFHLMSPRLAGTDPNYFCVGVGWTASLMDSPDYPPSSPINLQSVANSGKVKYDFRSTGRYLCLAMEFNDTADLQMTGAELDVEQTHGR